MNLLKVIAIFNWAVIAFLVYLVAMETIFPAKGGDAAGRGMGQAIYYLAIIALVILVILNFLPYKWAKYTAFGLILIPILFFQVTPIWRNMKRKAGNMIEASKPIFPDKERDQVARAIDDGKPEQVKKLLQEPISRMNENGELLAFAINSANSSSYKPSERLECVRLLFQAGARYDSTAADGTQMHMPVASNGDAALLRLLLENGADANTKDIYSNCPIIFEALASYQEPEASVRALLDFGANPNVETILDDEQGLVSPLVRAAEMGRWGVCVALLEKGAERHYKTKEGVSLQTFVDQAKQEFSADGYSTRADFERLLRHLQ